MLIMQTLSLPQRRMNTFTVLQILSCKQNLDGESNMVPGVAIFFYRLYLTCSIWQSMYCLATTLCIQLYTPRNHYATNKVFVGLIMQFHYVGLDKIPEQPHTVVQPVKSETIATAQAEQLEQVSDNELDDATVAEGDEHRRTITLVSRTFLQSAGPLL